MQHGPLQCAEIVPLYWREGGITQPPRGGLPNGVLIMFSTLINSTRDRMAKRRRYNQLVDEIMGMSSRDLSDINGSRSDMLHHAYKEVYGR